MAKAADRGTKRTCQNTSCGSRFYDLNRDPVVCPMCASVLQVLASATAVPAPAEARPRPAKKPEVTPPPREAPEAESEDALADVEGADEPVEAAGEEETFLEEEEEGGDVSGIIGTPAEGDEEP